MKIQKSPNSWSCLPTAFAMGMNIPVDELIKMIGHNGEDIIEGTGCRRGFHIQEIIPIGLSLGYSIINIEKHPKYIVPGDNQLRELELNYIPELMNNYSGIISGMWLNRSHAAYYENNHIYDPNGYDYALSLRRIDILFFFIIKSNKI